MSARADIKSQLVTDLDTQPISVHTIGENRAGFLRQQEDSVVIPGAVLATAVSGNNGSTLRLNRFPTQAKVKEVWVHSPTTTGLDNHATTATLALSFNTCWSDSAFDGTPAAYAGLIPKGTAGAQPVAFTDAAPNKYFGTITTPAVGNVAMKPIALIFNGFNGFLATGNWTYTGGLDTTINGNQPHWQFYGYVDGRGNAQDPGGFFDLLARVETAAATDTTGGTLVTVIKYVL
jgi:hypothetical protein